MRRLTLVELVIAGIAVWRAAIFIGEDAFPPIRWLREQYLSRWPSDDTSFTVSEVEQTGGGRVEVNRVWRNRHGVQVIPVEDGEFIPLYPSRWSKLITCMACLSLWLGIGAVLLAEYAPTILPWITYPLALSGVALLLDRLRNP